MTPSPPFVSVIVPVYNGERTIERCLDSILEQDYPHLERLVIDNCSTDRTQEIVQRYLDRIAYVRNSENLGLARSYNKAIRLATGGIIVFLQSDCAFAQTDYITRIVAHFQNPKIGAVTGKSILPGFQDLRWSERMYAILNLHDIGEGDGVGVHEVNFVEARADAFRREILDRVGGFNTDLTLSNEDMDLSIKTRRLGYQLLLDPAIRYVMGYGGTQDTYLKLLWKQYVLGRGEGYIIHRYGLAPTEKATDSLNRTLRVIHRGSQVLTCAALGALGALSSVSALALRGLVLLLVVRALSYALILAYYVRQGMKPRAWEAVLLVPTGMLCDVIYGASFFYGFLLGIMGRRV